MKKEGQQLIKECIREVKERVVFINTGFWIEQAMKCIHLSKLDQ